MILLFLRKLLGKASTEVQLPEPAQTDQFVWLNKQGVRSRDGFEVQSVGRFTIEYREGRLKASLDVERASYGGGSSVCINRNAFERWDNSSLTNSSEAQRRMRKNFRDGLAFMDIELED